jgi:RNA polymerase sigma-70 factor (ECF subfamily)
MHTTPATLLERLRRPADQAAWERFVKLYTPLLVHWARRLGVTKADTADLVQEIFTVLVKKLPDFRYDPGRRFRGWLWTITLNKHRERKRRPPLPVEAGTEEALARLPAAEEEGLDEAEYRQYLVQRTLELIRAEFQPTTWKAFWECVAADRPAPEVGAELHLSLDAVYAAKSRVLRRLRQELGGLLD